MEIDAERIWQTSFFLSWSITASFVAFSNTSFDLKLGLSTPDCQIWLRMNREGELDESLARLHRTLAMILPAASSTAK